MNPKNKRKRRRKRRQRRLILPVLFVLLCLLSAGALYLAYTLTRPASIEIQAKNAQILQGETAPADWSAKVHLTGNEHAVLDWKKFYTAKDLLKDLKSGGDYTVSCQPDPNAEGEYPITITLSDQLTRKLQSRTWSKHLKLTIKEGVFTVKNPIGEWEDNRFRKYDGTYVTNDFVVSKNQTYYFNQDGAMVTGWQTINNATYHFNDEGAMETSTWADGDNARYYLGENGAALTGWQDLDGSTYYFDANGIPVLDEPSDLEVHAVAYDMEDSTIQRTVPAQVSARVVVGDAEKEGYKKVALYVTVTCSDFAYNEEGGLDEDVAYNSGIYDLYTGRALPTRSTAGDAAYDYSDTVEVDGTSYDISYSKNIQWMVLPLDSGEVYRRCNQNWVLEVPEAYDGLVYCAVDPLSYDPASYSEEIDESEHYAMDLLNDESVAADTTVFFRFGTDIPA